MFITFLKIWLRVPDLHRWTPTYEAGEILLLQPANIKMSYPKIKVKIYLVRPAGIEPASARWQRAILPLNDGSKNAYPRQPRMKFLEHREGFEPTLPDLKGRCTAIIRPVRIRVTGYVFEWCRRLELNQLSLGYQPSAQTGELLRRY